MSIYADYAGSSDLSVEVKQYLLKRIADGPFANPNAIHYLGKTLMSGLTKAREICAQNIGAHPEQIIFNSGSTEGTATVMHSLLNQRCPKKTIITSAIEHPCINNLVKYYREKMGFQHISIPVSQDGIVDMNFLFETIKKNHSDIALCAIMAANNETGVIQPINEIGVLLNQHKIPFLCDTTQYIGKVPFDFNNSSVDYAILSGHKIGALTGIGFLVSKNPQTLSPLLIGGGQENGLRSGTQNYIGIETLAVAISDLPAKLKRYDIIKKQKMIFEAKIKAEYPSVQIIGEKCERLPGVSYIAYPGLHGQAIQLELESQQIYVSTSSACSDNEISTSKILKSMGINDIIGRGVIRISLGYDSHLQDYDQIFKHLSDTYRKLSKLNRVL